MSRNFNPIILACTAVGSLVFLPQTDAMAGKLMNNPKPVLVSQTTTPTATGSTLTVEVAGLRNARGQVCFSIFSNAQAFPQDPDRAIVNRCDKLTGTNMTSTFKGLKPGNYAVAILHDENLNRKDDRNFLNVPTEGFGFSKNPAVRLKAPSFDETAIPVTGATTSTKINVTYLTNQR